MGERPYWNMRVEPHLGTPRMRALQWRRLKTQLGWVLKHSPYHKERFERAKVHLRDLRTLDDFRSAVPFFTKDDHRESQEESLRRLGHGLGVHLSVPQEDVVLLSATSGTTGQPTFYAFSKEDLATYYEARARTYWRVGLRPGDRILLAFGLGMFIGGVPNVLGALRFGMSVVPAGAESGVERILKFASLTRPKAMIATPSLAEHLIERAPSLIGTEVGRLGLKVLLLGGEPGAGIPEVRSRLEGAYGARVFDFAGPTPSCEAEPYQGMHRITEDLTYEELVDPETRRPIEMQDGAEGELVATTLVGRAAPWVRFATGDLYRFSTTPCPCGRTGYRSRIVGRTDDMLKVKGVMVYPAGVQKVIAGFVPRVTGEFRIVLTERPPRVTPPMRIKIERGEGVAEANLPALEGEMADRMHAALRVRPAFEWVQAGSLQRFTHKTPYFEKLYERPKSPLPPPTPPQRGGEKGRSSPLPPATPSESPLPPGGGQGEGIDFFPGVLERDAHGRGRLIGGKCSACGKLHFPPRQACPRCHETKVERVPLSDRGKLFTYTICRMPLPHLQAPYAVGYADLPEGVRLFGLIAGGGDIQSRLRAGMELKVSIEPIREGAEGKKVWGYRFHVA